jgi:hypothetical protein
MKAATHYATSSKITEGSVKSNFYICKMYSFNQTAQNPNHEL